MPAKRPSENHPPLPSSKKLSSGQGEVCTQVVPWCFTPKTSNMVSAKLSHSYQTVSSQHLVLWEAQLCTSSLALNLLAAASRHCSKDSDFPEAGSASLGAGSLRKSKCFPAARLLQARLQAGRICLGLWHLPLAFIRRYTGSTAP